uniref:hypothetical protein n=1 Tax=Mesomycoplasma hyorhinis TaxID=2100 RepID=UPI001C0411B7
ELCTRADIEESSSVYKMWKGEEECGLWEVAVFVPEEDGKQVQPRVRGLGEGYKRQIYSIMRNKGK